MQSQSYESATTIESSDIYQQTAKQLAAMFLTKLEEIVKELERCGGDIKLMKSELRESLIQLEQGLPPRLKDKVIAKIKSAEKDHFLSVENLEKSKEELEKKRQDKKEASQAAMDFFKIFLPDMWVILINEKEKMNQGKKEDKFTSRLTQESNSAAATKSASSTSKIVSAHSIQMEAEHKEEHQTVFTKLLDLYNARLENIRKAIEMAGGDVAKLDPSMRKEITALQAILPDGQLRILNSFMEGKEKGQEVSTTLGEQRSQIAKELSEVTLATVDLSIMAASHRMAAGSLERSYEATFKQPLSPTRTLNIMGTAKAKSKDFSIADMEAFSKRVSGDPG